MRLFFLPVGKPREERKTYLLFGFFVCHLRCVALMFLQAFYSSEEPKKGVTEAPLDPNHTHFILVDDGRQHKYGAEIQLRAALESEITSIKSFGGQKWLPILTVIVTPYLSLSLS